MEEAGELRGNREGDREGESGGRCEIIIIIYIQYVVSYL